MPQKSLNSSNIFGMLNYKEKQIKFKTSKLQTLIIDLHSFSIIFLFLHYLVTPLNIQRENKFWTSTVNILQRFDIHIFVFLALADCVLFFGCRNSDKDFFFREEWQPLVKNGSLQLFTAFSRDQVNSPNHLSGLCP